MPEGDTLRRLATKITDRFAGDRVERSTMRDPRLATLDLAGATLLDADAYGKHLFIRFDGGRSLHAHLLMTGSFAVGRPSREPEWKRRVDLTLARGPLVGESVPILEMISTRDEHLVTDGLGPDLCSPGGPPDPEEVAIRMVSAPDDPLTGSMLDQRNVAGFGNLYANDVPFIVGLSPFQPVGTIDGVASAVAIGTALIRVNARRGPQNTVGRRLQTDARWVHGVGRRPCPVCGARMEHRGAHDTPWRRSVTWCPSCQPQQVRRAVDFGRVERLIALHPARRESCFPRRV